MGHGADGPTDRENTASGDAGFQLPVPSANQMLPELTLGTISSSLKCCTADSESVACHKSAGTSPSVTDKSMSSLTSELTKEDCICSTTSNHGKNLSHSERNSTDSTSRPNPSTFTPPMVATSLPEMAPSSSLLQASSRGSLLTDATQRAGGNALVLSRKRRRSDDNELISKRQPKASSATIAEKISTTILLGGIRYQPSTFKTWEQDLQLLKPDRASLTLGGLLTQQRTYTEALLCRGIVARIIHSWCLIAHERRLTTVDRRQSARRKQKEIRISLRTRKLGTLFVEIINQLSAQSDIGINAYKVCAALAGKYQHPASIDS